MWCILINKFLISLFFNFHSFPFILSFALFWFCFLLYVKTAKSHREQECSGFVDLIRFHCIWNGGGFVFSLSFVYYVLPLLCSLCPLQQGPFPIKNLSDYSAAFVQKNRSYACSRLVPQFIHIHVRQRDLQIDQNNWKKKISKIGRPAH